MSIGFVIIAGYLGIFALSLLVVFATVMIAGRSSRQCFRLIGDILLEDHVPPAAVDKTNISPPHAA